MLMEVLLACFLRKLRLYGQDLRAQWGNLASTPPPPQGASQPGHFSNSGELVLSILTIYLWQQPFVAFSC